MSYDENNIVSTHADCATCNATCYKLIDCDTYQTVSTSLTSFATYVGKTIKWIDEADAPDFIERCATVEAYTCRKETYPTPDITVIDCYDTCAECNYVEPRAPDEELVTGRSVKPGYTVPNCER